MYSKFLTLSLVLLSGVSFALDIPGGMNKSTEMLQADTYEMMISPGYTFKPSGAYLATEVRYQASQEFGTGFGFGAGEVGFNFGLTGTYHILRDDGARPGVAFTGGLHFNRLDQANYFALRLSPMLSKNFGTSFGRVTPYAALHFTPNFRLGEPENNFALKGSVGSEFMVKEWNDIRLIAEVGIGMASSNSEIMLGVAYPFVAL